MCIDQPVAEIFFGERWGVGENRVDRAFCHSGDGDVDLYDLS